MWTGTEDQIRILLLRHGETAENERGVYLGKKDVPLSSRGAEKIRRVAAKGIGMEPDLVVASPLNRCLETAGIFWPEAEVWKVEEFSEMDFGLWEGYTYSELLANPETSAAYQAWIDGGGVDAFPCGESREDYVKRVLAGWRMLCDRIYRRQQEIHRVALVVHGGTIMALMSSLFGGDYFDYRVAVGEGFTFLWNPKTGEVSDMEIMKSDREC